MSIRTKLHPMGGGIDKDKVVQVACSGTTTWYLTKSGDLYGCGDGQYGQQGNGSTTTVKTFTKRASGVASVACNEHTTWYLTKSGDLYGCGYNFYGQQGSGTYGSNANVLTFTKRASNVIQVVCSDFTTWYLTESGDLYGCGHNDRGQQGSGNTNDVYTFTKRASNVAQIVCSNYTTWYISTINAYLYGCGYNNYGQQGIGSSATAILAFRQLSNTIKAQKIYCSTGITWYLDLSNNLFGCGYGEFGQQGSGTYGSNANVKTFTNRASNVVQVTCSNNATWYLTESGDLYGCGRNNRGQQGSGDTNNVSAFTKRASNIAQVACLGTTTWYLTKSGDLYGCGSNNYGQQGSGNTSNVLTFTKRN